MSRFKSSLITASRFACAWLAIAGVVAAQTGPTEVASEDQSIGAFQNVASSGVLNGTYFDVRNMTGSGIGYRNGYTQLGGMMPIWLGDDWFIAPNARLFITDQSRIGSNTGGLFRIYSGDLNRAFGVYAYYDTDKSNQNISYDQFSFGAETLGENWDFRINGYVPGRKTNAIGALGLSNTPHFVGNQLAFIGTCLYEQSSAGGDFEFGMPVTPSMQWLRAYAGMYVYESHGTKPIGVKARVEGWVTNDTSVGVQVSDDRQFGTNVNAVVEFRFSGFNPTRYFPQYSTRERMTTSVQRNWRIATTHFTESEDVAAINPATGNPYFITWVDPSNPNPGAGAGTFENPFKALPANTPADLILVRGGGSTALNPITGNIALADNQRLLGSGFDYTTAARATYGGITVNGTYHLPDPGFNQVNPALRAFLGGSPGADGIVTLANNNEVSGFFMTGHDPGDAITNTIAGSNGFFLHDLDIFNNGGGIVLTTAGGVGEGNATGNGRIINVNAFNNATDGGILVGSGANPLNLTLTNINTSDPNAADRQPVGIQIDAINAAVTANLNQITANDNRGAVAGTGTGLRLQSFNGQTLTATMVGAVGQTNSADNNGGTGIELNSQPSGTVNLTTAFLDASNNGLFGIGSTMTGGTLILSGNQVTANGNNSDNVNLNLANNSRMSVGFTNSQFNSSVTGSGIAVNLDQSNGLAIGANPGLSLLGVTLNNNLIGDGLQVSANNNSKLTTNLSNVLANNNGRDGYHFDANGAGSVLTVNASPASLPGSLPIAGNNNTRDGLHFTSTAGGRFVGSIGGTSAASLDKFNSNGRDAIFAQVGAPLGADTIGSSGALTLSNIQGQLSGGDGMHLEAFGQGAILPTLAVSAVNADFSNSGRLIANSAGVFLNADKNATGTGAAGTGAIVKLALNGVTATNNAALGATNEFFGMNLNLNNGSTLLQTGATTNGVIDAIVGGNYSNNLGNALNLNVQNNSASTLLLQQAAGTAGRVNYSGSGQNGLNLLADTKSTVNVTATNIDFSNSGKSAAGLGTQDAMHVVDHGDSSVTLNINNVLASNPATGNQQRGLFFDVQSAALPGGTGSTFNFNADQTGTASSNLSGNLLNAIRGFVNTDATDTGIPGLASSTVNLRLTNTNGNNSGADAFRFSADNSTVTATVTGATFNNAGSIAGGDGFLAQLTNNASFQDTFTNTQFNDAGKNATTGIYDANSNAFEIRADQSTANINFSNVQGNRAGNDGLLITATNNSSVTSGTLPAGGIQNSSFSDNDQSNAGVNGAGLEVQVATNSIVNLQLNATNLNNSATATPPTQQYGMFVNATTGAQSSITMQGGDLSRNLTNAVNSFASGAATTSLIAISGANADNSGSDGVVLNAVGGAANTFNFSGGSISNSGVNVNGGINAPANGITASVTGANSQLNVNLTDAVVNTNLRGFDGTATQNGALNLSFTRGSFDSNLAQGVTFLVDTGAKFTGIGIGGSISKNGTGTGGPFDGVTGVVDGNNSLALFSMDGTTVDQNAANGINLGVSNNAELDFGLLSTGANGIASVSNNGFNGIVVSGDVNNTATAVTSGIANVYMKGNNVVSNNGAGAGGPYNNFKYTANGVTSAVVNLAGNFDAASGDGINVSLTNVNTAAFSVVGDPTAGSSVSNNGGYGINLQATGTTFDDINLTNVLLTPAFTASAFTISDETVNLNKLGGVNVVASAGAFNKALTLSKVTANSNQNGDGIRLDFTNMNINVGPQILNTQAASNIGNGTTTGNGLVVNLNNSPIPAGAGAGLTIQGIPTGGAGYSSNQLDGILINATNGSKLNNLQIGGLAANQGVTANSNTQNNIEIRLANSDLTNGKVEGSTFNSAGKAGFLLNNPTTAGQAVGINFTKNTASNNGTNGVELAVNTNSVGLNTTFLGNTFNSNSRLGVRLQATDNASLNATFGNATGATATAANQITGNHGAGIGIYLADTNIGNGVGPQANLIVNNTTINGTLAALGGNADSIFTGGDGLAVSVTGDATVSKLQIGSGLGVTANNTTFTQNARDGIRITRTDDAAIDQTTIDHITSSNNIGNGVFYQLAGGTSISPQGFFNLNVANSTFNSNTVDGVRVNLLASTDLRATTNPVDPGLNGIIANTFTGNGGFGVNMITNQATSIGGPPAGPNPYNIHSNTFTNNGNVGAHTGGGIQLTVNDASFQDIDLGQNAGLARQTFSGNQNGIQINNNSSAIATGSQFSITKSDFSGDFNSININNTGIATVNVGTGAVLGDVTIKGWLNDGILASSSGGQLTLNVTETNISNAPNVSQTGVNAIEIQMSGGSANTINITNSVASGSRTNGILVNDTSVLASTVGIQGTDISRNLNGRGLAITVAKPAANGAGGSLPSGSSTFNIGNVSGNNIAQNGQQGFLFAQALTSGDQATQAQFAGSTSAVAIPQTTVAGGLSSVTFGTDLNPIPGLRDITSPDVVTSRVNFINNTVSGNGVLQIANNTDGSAFVVGTSTRLNLNYSGNTHTGNIGNSVFFTTGVSTPNLRNSVLNTPNNNPFVANDGVDYLVADPVAHLDLIFGANATTGNAGPLNTGDRFIAANNTSGGVATSIVSSLQGPINQLAGTFTNNDPAKGAGRSGILYGEIQQKVAGDLNGNNFTQLGVTQVMSNGATGFFDSQFNRVANPTVFTAFPNGAFPP